MYTLLQDQTLDATYWLRRLDHSGKPKSQEQLEACTLLVSL